MRKYLAAILIISYLLNAGGYLFFYLPCKAILKENAQNKLSKSVSKSEIEIIKIIKSEIDSNSSDIETAGENEIRFHNKLYDVIKKIERGELIIYYCVADEPENLLEKLIQNNFEDENLNAHKKNVKNLFKSLITDVLIHDVFLSVYPNYEDQFNLVYLTSHLNHISKIFTPPPQFNS